MFYLNIYNLFFTVIILWLNSIFYLKNSFDFISYLYSFFYTVFFFCLSNFFLLSVFFLFLSSNLFFLLYNFFFTEISFCLKHIFKDETYRFFSNKFFYMSFVILFLSFVILFLSFFRFLFFIPFFFKSCFLGDFSNFFKNSGKEINSLKLFFRYSSLFWVVLDFSFIYFVFYIFNFNSVPIVTRFFIFIFILFSFFVFYFFFCVYTFNNFVLSVNETFTSLVSALLLDLRSFCLSINFYIFYINYNYPFHFFENDYLNPSRTISCPIRFKALKLNFKNGLSRKKRDLGKRFVIRRVAFIMQNMKKKISSNSVSEGLTQNNMRVKNKPVHMNDLNEKGKEIYGHHSFVVTPLSTKSKEESSFSLSNKPVTSLNRSVDDNTLIKHFITQPFIDYLDPSTVSNFIIIGRLCAYYNTYIISHSKDYKPVDNIDENIKFLDKEVHDNLIDLNPYVRNNLGLSTRYKDIVDNNNSYSDNDTEV